MNKNTFLEVDMNIWRDNIEIYRTYGENYRNIMLVGKANSYGVGIFGLLELVESLKIDWICVANIDEAIQLRKLKYKKNILILGYLDYEDIELAIINNISVTISSLTWLKKTLNSKNICKLRLHLKIDTGMNRLGLKTIDEIKEIKEILSSNNMKLEGIFTHFAKADELDHSYTKKNYNQFINVLEKFELKDKIIHCSNSEAQIFLNDQVANYARLGIGMYGVSNFCKEIKNVVSLKTTITNIKFINPGEQVGYGGTYISKEKEIIATIPIGYADGFLRTNQGRHVFVNGKYCEIVGRICMDQCMIRLEEWLPIGTEVEIFGKNISLESIAKENNTIPYEILTSISDRVTRKYININSIKYVNYRFDLFEKIDNK